MPVDRRSKRSRPPLPRCYHGLACEPFDRSGKVHPRDVRVPLRRRQMRMARERLHGRRRDSSSKKRGDEVVAKVVQTKGLHTARLRARTNV